MKNGWRRCMPRRSFVGIVGGTFIIVGFIIIFSDFEKLGSKISTKSLTKSIHSTVLKNNTVLFRKSLLSNTKLKRKSDIQLSSGYWDTKKLLTQKALTSMTTKIVFIKSGRHTTVKNSSTGITKNGQQTTLNESKATTSKNSLQTKLIGPSIETSISGRQTTENSRQTTLNKSSTTTSKNGQQTIQKVSSTTTSTNSRQTTPIGPSTTSNDGQQISMKQKESIKENKASIHKQTSRTKIFSQKSSTDSDEKTSRQPERTNKLILLWRELYKSVKSIQGHFTQVCPSCNCSVTNDRKFLSKADAVLFEVEGMYQLPRKPKSGQVWVYVEMEAPTYMGNGLAKWDNLFNWTMTYRRDSDIQTFYGSVWPKEKRDHQNNKEDFSKNKTARMLWMVGHCKTPGEREKYVNELKQFIDVDTIGRCGKRTCGREKPCENEMLRQYKYYFAAENSDCRDYITEKAFRTLLFPILPIVKGGSNYSVFLPPKSYVHVNSFSTPENFAKYIKTMDENKDIYNGFFPWKNDYVGQFGVPDNQDPFCKLCDRLHNQSKYRRLYKSIHDWWRGNERTAGEYFCPVHQLARL